MSFHNKTARKNKKAGAKIYSRKVYNNHSEHGSSNLKNFEKEVTLVFFEMLLLVKLYHWNTYSYATHKATDDLYSTLNSHIDEFMEVLMGKANSRIELAGKRCISLHYLTSNEQMRKKVEQFKSYLVGLEKTRALQTMSNSDLFNIRDEILADMNKFLYLLTLK
jgi:DNA-binding ferritin-like protein